MYKYFNAHPKGLRVKDCVKRAITKATGNDYMEVQRKLNECKKITGCNKFNDNKNWKYYVEEVLGAIKISFPAVSGEERMNGKRFMNEYYRGTYILRMAGHLSVCVDGHIYDTWDCSDCCVYTAYKIVDDKDRLKLSSKYIDDTIKSIKKKYNAKIKKLRLEMQNEINLLEKKRGNK
jgi:hypothetical protein